MKSARLGIVFFSLLLLLVAPLTVLAAEKMKYEDYLAEQERWEQRESDAVAQMEGLQKEIEKLNAEIAALDQEIAAVQAATLNTLGSTETSRSNFTAQLDATVKSVQQMSKYTVEALYEHKDELEALGTQIDALLQKPDAALPENYESAQQLAAQFRTMKGRMAKPRSSLYTVVKGDYLWRIAGMPQFFSDPWKWMRIYSVNSDKISDPDLIYAGQDFVIPLDVDKKKQYLVQKGDHLYSIAQGVYGDPFEWKKLYEANESVIKDPNSVFPETILTLPGR